MFRKFSEFRLNLFDAFSRICSRMKTRILKGSHEMAKAKTNGKAKLRSNKLEVRRDPDGFRVTMLSGNGRMLMESVDPYEFKSQAMVIAKSIAGKRNWEIVDREAA